MLQVASRGVELPSGKNQEKEACDFQQPFVCECGQGRVNDLPDGPFTIYQGSASV